MSGPAPSELRPVGWSDERVLLLDQRLLPGREEWLAFDDVETLAEAIRAMVVRGAPAIGITAAYGVALAVRRASARGTGHDLLGVAEAAAALLRATRPTAVNLAWAIERLLTAVRRAAIDEIPDVALACAIALHEEDVASCRTIGQLGARLLPDDVREGRRALLTHCNAGALATGGYGTALGVVRAAREAGHPVRVIACETRPFLQGARLTAWELQRDGIPVELITDGMAAHLMARGEIGAALVGADRIAASGDVANKIGTYCHALAARAHDLPFLVAAPWSTVDLATADGQAIPIEERSAVELLSVGGVRIAPEGVGARHPAFDVTPASLVTALVTERGVARAPLAEALQRLAIGLEASAKRAD